MDSLSITGPLPQRDGGRFDTFVERTNIVIGWPKLGSFYQHVFFAVRGLKIEKNPVRIQNFPRRASLRHGITGVTAA